jgi:hypothetical protein
MAYEVGFGGAKNAATGAPGTLTAERELFLKVFSQMVMRFYNNKTIMLDKNMVRQISSGKSAQFPIVGKASATYHTPGDEIEGGAINSNERVISIDRVLISSVFVDNLDKLMSHYDFASMYAEELATAIALKSDLNILKEVILAARATAVLTEGAGGTEIESDDFNSANQATRAAALAAGIYSAAQALDENNVPMEDRYCLLKPREYYDLVENKEAINQDWGGSGSYAEGNIFKVAGIPIFMTNQIPRDDSSADTFHGVNATKTTGVVFHKSAVGTVKAMDISTESDYQLERLGHLIVAKNAMGHGILRPESAVELKLDVTTY